MSERPDSRAPSRRTEVWIIGLVLAASGLVMLAPLLGRWGAPELANAVMIAAAGCGVVSWGAAGVHTVRAARRVRPPDEEGKR